MIRRTFHGSIIIGTKPKILLYIPARKDKRSTIVFYIHFYNRRALTVWKHWMWDTHRSKRGKHIGVLYLGFVSYAWNWEMWYGNRAEAEMA